MHVLSRRIGAVLVGALIVMALALTMSARADAATTKVEIAVKAKIKGLNGQVFSNQVMNPRASFAMTGTSNPNSDLKTFIKEDVGQAARYRWSFAPDKCLTGTLGSPHITMKTCIPFAADQLWTQGFSGGLFREFRNVKTGRVATAQDTKSHNGTSYAEVIADAFFGDDRQLWQVRPV